MQGTILHNNICGPIDLLLGMYTRSGIMNPNMVWDCDQNKEPDTHCYI